MKNRLKVCLSFVFLVLTLFSVPGWGMEEKDCPLTAIVKRTVSPDGHRVVFDMDDTLCIRPNVSKTNRASVGEKYPNAQLMRFWNGMKSEGNYNHDDYFFYPHYGEVFLTLLDWGWHVDVFSAAEKERNEAVMPAYLKVTLAPYSQDIQADYATLTHRGDLRVFSYHHLSYEKDRVCTQYDRQGDYKKDLSVAGTIPDTILVDDDRSYAKGNEQYPFIGLGWSASSRFSRFFLTPRNENLRDSDNPLHNAAYVLGILAECKDLLDRQEGTSLRAALDIVLQNPHCANPDYPLSRDETPWFLYPDEKNPKLKTWISRGNVLIDQMRARAKPRESGEEKTNYSEVAVDKSMFIPTIDRPFVF